MSTPAKTRLLQRSDYTQKFNARTGRHGWLRLTPAYSVKIVEELLGLYEEPLRVLDPFSGTGTTVLSAAYHGHEGTTTEINPFLVWLGQTKTAHYSAPTLASTRATAARVAEAAGLEAAAPVEAPPIYNIDRWWSPEALDFLCRLKACIDRETCELSQERSLLLVAFCRTLIGVSNAAFNHQSMSFKNDHQLQMPLGVDMASVFSQDVRFVLRGAADNPRGAGHVLLGDSRSLPATVDGTFDLVITSPPYANRMSYIRELRPYMYWLGFLSSGRAAGELDWEAIGGTWGVATSRLNDWVPSTDRFSDPRLESALDQIAHQDNMNGKLMATYVAKYFDDMWAHLRSLVPVLSDGSRVHYIVGNSTFYGVLLSVELYFVAMLERLGFDRVESRAIRKRNSKKELIEFDVSARWGGRTRLRAATSTPGTG